MKNGQYKDQTECTTQEATAVIQIKNGHTPNKTMANTMQKRRRIIKKVKSKMEWSQFRKEKKL